MHFVLQKKNHQVLDKKLQIKANNLGKRNGTVFKKHLEFSTVST